MPRVGTTRQVATKPIWSKTCLGGNDKTSYNKAHLVKEEREARSAAGQSKTKHEPGMNTERNHFTDRGTSSMTCPPDRRYPTAAPLHQNLADTTFIPTAGILTGEPPVDRKSDPLGMLRFPFLAFDVQGCDETFAAFSCDHGVDANFNS